MSNSVKARTLFIHQLCYIAGTNELKLIYWSHKSYNNGKYYNVEHTVFNILIHQNNDDYYEGYRLMVSSYF